MDLNHEFSVAAPIEQVWAALTDLRRSAGCVPNVTVTGGDADAVDVEVQASFGPLDLTGRAAISLAEHDETAHRAVLRVAATDSDGDPLADATTTIVLTQLTGRTDATVQSHVETHGVASLAGEGTLDRAAGETITTFAANLEALLSGPAGVA